MSLYGRDIIGLNFANFFFLFVMNFYEIYSQPFPPCPTSPPRQHPPRPCPPSQERRVKIFSIPGNDRAAFPNVAGVAFSSRLIPLALFPVIFSGLSPPNTLPKFNFFRQFHRKTKNFRQKLSAFPGLFFLIREASPRRPVTYENKSRRF